MAMPLPAREVRRQSGWLPGLPGWPPGNHPRTRISGWGSKQSVARGPGQRVEDRAPRGRASETEVEGCTGIFTPWGCAVVKGDKGGGATALITPEESLPLKPFSKSEP